MVFRGRRGGSASPLSLLPPTLRFANAHLLPERQLFLRSHSTSLYLWILCAAFLVFKAAASDARETVGGRSIRLRKRHRAAAAGRLCCRTDCCKECRARYCCRRGMRPTSCGSIRK